MDSSLRAGRTWGSRSEGFQDTSLGCGWGCCFSGSHPNPFSVSLPSACVSYLWSLLVTPLLCAPSLLLGSSVGCRFSVCVGVCLLFLSLCRCQHFLCVCLLLCLSPLWLCRLSAFLFMSFWAPFHFPLCLHLPPTCLSPPLPSSSGSPPSPSLPWNPLSWTPSHQWRLRLQVQGKQTGQPQGGPGR